jgi:hypothetical protein
MKKLSLSLSPAALWASAFVLMGLIVVQSSQLTSEAKADVVATTGTLTALTFTATNEDLLAVLDGRTEELYLYRGERNGVNLIQIYNLPALFAEARARATGTRR